MPLLLLLLAYRGIDGEAVGIPGHWLVEIRADEESWTLDPTAAVLMRGAWDTAQGTRGSSAVEAWLLPDMVTDPASTATKISDIWGIRVSLLARRSEGRATVGTRGPAVAGYATAPFWKAGAAASRRRRTGSDTMLP